MYLLIDLFAANVGNFHALVLNLNTKKNSYSSSETQAWLIKSDP